MDTFLEEECHKLTGRKNPGAILEPLNKMKQFNVFLQRKHQPQMTLQASSTKCKPDRDGQGGCSGHPLTTVAEVVEKPLGADLCPPFPVPMSLCVAWRGLGIQD